MEISQTQARIDAINWYHEFDFGNGLKAGSKRFGTEIHRRSWKFLKRNLDTIDFKDKSVLDIGCWDGYWSFDAERRGQEKCWRRMTGRKTRREGKVSCSRRSCSDQRLRSIWISPSTISHPSTGSLILFFSLASITTCWIPSTLWRKFDTAAIAIPSFWSTVLRQLLSARLRRFTTYPITLASGWPTREALTHGGCG